MCIEESFGDAGITATESQISEVVDCVKGAFENYNLATGLECIPNPINAEVARLRDECRKLQEQIYVERDNFRKNVAMRRGCDVNDVELLGDGHAEYRR